MSQNEPKKRPGKTGSGTAR